jgi:hypothetical protein
MVLITKLFRIAVTALLIYQAERPTANALTPDRDEILLSQRLYATLPEDALVKVVLRILHELLETEYVALFIVETVLVVRAPAICQISPNVARVDVETLRPI